ncbi:periplasmic sensor diguanylate cyclase/phosphodiesterase [Halomonas ventosae]|uniref:cyclic-guanylate-specific phosphodiesterase n=1 Tax=Halomonas ventosae TaxID=229007 RepID=A0A4R6ZTP6_9GAMM|nr:EAL domain-containing protein [Halomonas ventosae]TDR55978.1 periplasmic sensor diguanylate cyclase/phosphodiesterase [Halomonas ventosae]
MPLPGFPRCWRFSPVMLCATLLCGLAQANETLRVGIYHNPPKLMLDENQAPSGILGELLQAMAGEENWDIEVVSCHWHDCLAGLHQGEIDLLPDVAWSTDRATRLDFHREPALRSWSQVYQAAGQRLESVVDLDRHRVAVLDGSIQERYLQQLATGFDIDIDLQGFETQQAAFDAVRRGLADAVIVNRHFGDWQLPEQDVSATPIMFQPVRLHYAALPGAQVELLERIDARLAAWKADPDSPYFAILERWGVRREEGMQVPRAFWWGLSFLGGVLALALGGNLLLRRRVAERTRELASSEQRLASILDSVEACIFIKTPELRYAYVNQRVCDLLGRPAEAILGCRDEAFYDAETAARLRADDLSVFDEGRKIRQEEHNVLATSGEQRVFLSTKLPLRDTAGRITSLCGIATDLTDYREILEQNHRMAFHDALTDLPNRRLLMERLGQAIRGVHRTERFAALLLIDLDQFKLVNDLHSHLTGDRLLQRMATRLAAYTDDVNTLAHLGGDEFALLIEDLAPPLESAAQRAERVAMDLLETIRHARDHEDDPTVTASIGLTILTGNDVDAGRCMQQADIALGQAKGANGNALRFFNPEMHARVKARARLESDLQRALERQELLLYYQLKVDRQQRPIGLEALLRWQHPERGLVSPADFIPLAEQSGLILPIGHWVLETACHKLVEWADIPGRDTLTIAVNVSTEQFRQRDFTARVKEVLERTGADPRRLVLEVTESLLMNNPEQVKATLAELRRSGIRLALDDFGTGYSSLNYLKQLPLDELKIDRSFTSGVMHSPADAAIVETTLTLAENLGLAVIAEGVETDAQFEWVRARGCTGFQGFLFGRPVPEEMLDLPCSSTAQPPCRNNDMAGDTDR